MRQPTNSPSTNDGTIQDAKRPQAVRALTTPIPRYLNSPEGRPLFPLADVPSKRSARPPSPFPSTRSWSPSGRNIGSAHSSCMDFTHLTPPVSEGDAESPPFKPSENDRSSLSMFNEAKYRSRKERGSSEVTIQSGDTTGSGMSEVSRGRVASKKDQRPRELSPKARDLEKVEWEMIKDDLKAYQSLGEVARPSLLEHGAGMRRKSTSAVMAKTATKHPSTLSEHSPHERWLRRSLQLTIDMSQRHKAARYTPQPSSKLRGWSINSLSTSSSPSLRTNASKSPLERPPLRESRTTMSGDRSAKVRDYHGKTSSRFQDVPATIVLRRASTQPRERGKRLFGSFVSSSRRNSKNVQGVAQQDCLTDEHPLERESMTRSVDDVSQHIAHFTWRADSKRGWSSDSAEMADDEEDSPIVSSNLSRKVTISNGLIFPSNILRRCSTANPATTYANVHMVRFDTNLDPSPPRTFSTTQVVRSRNSVYEIIWKDDYSSGSYSSYSLGTPRLSLQLERIESCLRAFAQERDSRQSSNASSRLSASPNSDPSSAPDYSHRVSIVDKRQYQQEKNRLASNFASWGWTINTQSLSGPAGSGLRDQARDSAQETVPGLDVSILKGQTDADNRTGFAEGSSAEEDVVRPPTDLLNSERSVDGAKMGYAIGASQHRRRSSVLSAPAKSILDKDDDVLSAMTHRERLTARFQHRDSLALTRKRYSKRGNMKLRALEA